MSSPYSTPPETLPPEIQYVPPTSGRPTGVTVFAILNILFGVTGLFGTIFSAAFLFVGSRLGPNPVLDMMQASLGYLIFFIVSIVLGLIFSVILLVSGIGLLKMSKLARKLAIAYAVYAIIASVVGNVVNVIVVFLPLVQQAGQQQGAQIGVMIGSIFGAIIGGLISLILPIAILIYFLRRSVKQSFESWQS